MLNINNKTPFDIALSQQTNLQGHDCICAFFASSFVLQQNRWHISDKQMASPLTDVFLNPDKPSSIRYPSQLSHSKPGTDIIVNAHAIAPQGKPVTSLQAGISVGNVKASVVVFGDRVWHHDKISTARPFVRIPIVWECAFGGISREPTLIEAQAPNASMRNEYNPLGLGWTDPSHTIKNGTRLPNIEWRDSLIRDPRDCPAPAGFGALSPESPMRSCYAGTYDEKWKQTRCPYAPHDFDPAFFQAAIPALRYSGYMQGNETVRMKNLHEVEDVAFALPNAKPTGTIVLNGKTIPLVFKLDTVVIETQTLEVKLFWQATTAASRSVADVEEVSVWLAR